MRRSRAQLFRPALLPREPPTCPGIPATPEWNLGGGLQKTIQGCGPGPEGPDPAKPGVYAFAEKISLALFTEARTAFRHSLASCSPNAICSRATRATSSKTALAWAMLLLCSLVISCTADSNRAVCSATAFSSELAACSTCALNSAMTASWVPAGFSARRFFVQCNITQPDWLSRVCVAMHHGAPSAATLVQRLLQLLELPPQLRDVVGRRPGGRRWWPRRSRCSERARKGPGHEREERVVGSHGLHSVPRLQVHLERPGHVLAEELRERVVAHPDELHEEGNGKQAGGTAPLDDDLGQGAGGEVLARLGVGDVDVLAALDQLGELLEGDVAAPRRIVEPPVAVFLDEHPSPHMLACSMVSFGQ